MIDITKILCDYYITQLLLDNNMKLYEDEDFLTLTKNGKPIATFSGIRMDIVTLTKAIENITEAGL